MLAECKLAAIRLKLHLYGKTYLTSFLLGRRWRDRLEQAVMQYNNECRDHTFPVAKEYAGGGRDSVLSMLSGQDTRAHSRATLGNGGCDDPEEDNDGFGEARGQISNSRQRMNRSAGGMVAKLVRDTVEVAVCQGFDMALTPASSRPRSGTSGLGDEDGAPHCALHRQYRSRQQPGLQ